ncbi:alpha/beta hydrolase [Streptomyces sp. NBC_00091]|uniref:alpha/beta hydrolase n=1 Tax=Streptomyces sp. NBC_00091 TaxID=2975648 RepID=UPI0022514780|nr:alpha/beta hydrolase [Streptomyces sp. NBC_00091]MCX5375225.1 alpha/beta hydrolase [Streptomyces sp. NBC_00091]
MRTALARQAVAAAALCLTLCAPAPARASGGSTAGPGPGPAPTAAEDAGAELVARRAAAAAALRPVAVPPPAGGAPGAPAHGTRPVPGPAAGAARLDFRPCPAAEELPGPVRCATLRVPLDYARPDGPQISLTVSRVPATGRGGAARQGALVYNPGGPGASGMFFPLLADRPAWARIAAAYDLVGYAPRGVGRSAPLVCQDPAERPHGPTQVPAEPSPAHKRERLAAAQAYARGCARHAGAALAHYTTLNNARDLDVLRAALGEPRLSFMGASYGTYLGAVYATRHPDRVRRMVFDSAVDPDPRRIWYRNNLAQAPGFERRWADFRAWAARHHAAYGLGTTARAVRASYEKVRATVARTPAGGVVGTGELHAAYLQTAYYDDVWPERAAALAAFLRGDPGPLTRQAAPDPRTAAEAANATAVYTAVLCNDAPWPADWETWDRDNTELARRAPFETWANAFLNLPCASWPVSERQRPVEVGAPAGGLPSTLIVAAERDGATPHRGALELQRRLGARAALVTEQRAGTHGVAGGLNACVDRHVERYLLTGATPGWRITCAPHPEPAPVSLDDRATSAPRALLPPVV